MFIGDVVVAKTLIGGLCLKRNRGSLTPPDRSEPCHDLGFTGAAVAHLCGETGVAAIVIDDPRHRSLRRTETDVAQHPDNHFAAAMFFDVLADGFGGRGEAQQPGRAHVQHEIGRPYGVLIECTHVIESVRSIKPPASDEFGPIGCEVVIADVVSFHRDRCPCLTGPADFRDPLSAQSRFLGRGGDGGHAGRLAQRVQDGCFPLPQLLGLETVHQDQALTLKAPIRRAKKLRLG